MTQADATIGKVLALLASRAPDGVIALEVDDLKTLGPGKTVIDCSEDERTILVRWEPA